MCDMIEILEHFVEKKNCSSFCVASIPFRRSLRSIAVVLGVCVCVCLLLLAMRMSFLATDSNRPGHVTNRNGNRMRTILYCCLLRLG